MSFRLHFVLCLSCEITNLANFMEEVEAKLRAKWRSRHKKDILCVTG